MHATFLPTLLLAALAARPAAAAQAQVVYVDGAARPGGDGSSWRSPLRSLDDALALAAAGGADAVWVREGVYVPSRDGVDPRDAAFDVAAGVSVVGGFAGYERSPCERDIASHPTILSGDLRGNDEIDGDRSDNAYRVVRLLSGVVSLDGLTIRGGQADGATSGRREGAAIGGNAAAIRVEACRIEANVSEAGGAALAARGAGVILRGCAVRANRAGGGVVALAPGPGDPIAIEGCTFDRNEGSAVVVDGAPDEGQLVVAGCGFTANAAGDGATVEIAASHATLSSCVFAGNAGSDGAAVRATSSVLLLRDSALSENVSSGRGGAVFATSGDERPMRIERCVLVGNVATHGGAAAIDGAVRATFVRCTFAANEAAASGGAVASGAADAEGAPGPALRLEHCALRGNRTDGAGGALHANRHAVEIADCLVVGNLAAIGGAVRGAFTSASVTRSTVAGNRATGLGGGIVKSEGALTLVDSVVWGNEAARGDAFGSQVLLAPPGAAPAPLVLLRSCVQSLPSEYESAGGFAGDPAFVDLDGEDDVAGTADDDASLGAASPCVNRGDPTLAAGPWLDVAGDPRVAACRVDLGAIESALQPASDPDCDGDGTSDACAIAAGDGDCDGNGVPDACEIAAGADDCDGNGVPDACELALEPFSVASALQAPFGGAVPLVVTLPDPGPAQSDVTFTLTARGDFGAVGRYVDIRVNGVSVGSILETGSHCAHAPEVRSYAIPKGDWNAIVGGGEIAVAFVPTEAVDPDACVRSFAQASIAFSLLPAADANSNGLVDACEPGPDLDGDGAVGPADLAALLGAWGPCGGCNADVDRSGEVGAEDLAVLLAAWTEA
jgi:hypothetical protein